MESDNTQEPARDPELAAAMEQMHAQFGSIGKALSGMLRPDPVVHGTAVGGGVPHVFCDNRYTIHQLEALLPAPTRTRRLTEHTTVESLAAYTSTYTVGEDHSTATMVDTRGYQITAVLDYDQPGAPAWGDHRAKFNAAFTPEWTAWADQNEQWMRQEHFAIFIEDHLGDVLAPAAADLIDMVKTINVVRNGGFTSSVDLGNGCSKVAITNEAAARCGVDALEVPRKLRLKLPVFVGGDPVEVDVRLALDANDGYVRLRYRILNTDAVLAAAFDQLVVGFQEALDCVIPVYHCR